jgi:hypothetical protein
MPSKLSHWLGHLCVGRKLTLIYLLDLTAVIYVSGILIHEKYLAIDFARKEIVGATPGRQKRRPAGARPRDLLTTVGNQSNLILDPNLLGSILSLVYLVAVVRFP